IARQTFLSEPSRRATDHAPESEFRRSRGHSKPSGRRSSRTELAATDTDPESHRLPRDVRADTSRHTESPIPAPRPTPRDRLRSVRPKSTSGGQLRGSYIPVRQAGPFQRGQCRDAQYQRCPADGASGSFRLFSAERQPQLRVALRRPFFEQHARLDVAVVLVFVAVVLRDLTVNLVIEDLADRHAGINPHRLN